MNLLRSIALLFLLLPAKIMFAYGTDANIDSLRNLLKKESDFRKKGGLMYEIGNAYFGNNRDSSIYYLTTAHQIAIVTRDVEFQSKTAAVLGTAYQYVDPVKSTEFILKSVDLAEQTDDPELIAYCYNILGTHYRINGDWDRAKEIFEKAIDIREVMNDSLGIAVGYNNIGIVYMLEGEYETGMDYWKKSLDIKLAIGQELSAAYSMANIAIYYKDIGRYYEAKEYLENALEIEFRLNDHEGASHSLTVLGDLYVKMNNNHDAVRTYEQALSYVDSLNASYDRMDPLLGLSKAYENSGQYKKAVETLREYINLSEDHFDESKTRIANEMRTKYETDKKEKENLLLKSENEINEAKLKEEAAKNELQKANIIYLIIGLGLVLIILIAIVIFLNKVRSAKKEIEIQKDIVEEKNREITDSISYAKRLQEAILPPDEVLSSALNEHFILYQPKDIVAGDFYWMEYVRNGSGFDSNKVLLAAADCTGHGVPGAMVSVVCHNALNRAIRELKLMHPGEILDKVTDLVIETFEKSQAEVKDGMDIALCLIDKNTGKLEYSGANNSLYLIRNGELTEYKPTKQPIGKYADRKPFQNNEIELQKGDIIYLFTDGFADQFGGDKGKKMKYRSFKEILTTIHEKSMDEQKKVINQKFHEWMGDYEQVDDVCVIGVRI